MQGLGILQSPPPPPCPNKAGDEVSLLPLVLFQVTDDVSDITMAHFLGQKGRRTAVAARFSTVTHEKGSPESLRDVRGFSVNDVHRAWQLGLCRQQHPSESSISGFLHASGELCSVLGALVD